MSSDENRFLERLRATEFLDDENLAAFVSRLGPAERASEEATATACERAGLLTRFQIDRIQAGESESLRLGSYLLLEPVGKGGMGEVFRARHQPMHRVVALKILPESLTRQPEAVRRFRREVQAAARLSHPHVVTAYDAGESRGVHFLVLEYVPGRDLAARVRDEGPLPVADAIQVVRQAATGLSYAHGQGVIHRDIKPSNLLQSGTGEVKVLDLGLARIDLAAEEPTAAALTSSGAVMGTVDYMSPEQALDTRHADGRSDIYSLGCTLFFLLTGRPPFGGQTAMQKLVAHREAAIPSLQEACPGVSPALEELFRNMLAKRPEDRPQTMDEVVRRLDEIATGIPGEPEPTRIVADGQRSVFVGATREQIIADDQTVIEAGDEREPTALARGSVWQRWIRSPQAWLAAAVGIALLGNLAMWLTDGEPSRERRTYVPKPIGEAAGPGSSLMPSVRLLETIGQAAARNELQHEGDWGLPGPGDPPGSLLSPATPGAWLEIPYDLPQGGFRLELTVERFPGAADGPPEELLLIVPVWDRQTAIVVGRARVWNGVENIDGRPVEENESGQRSNVFSPGLPTSLSVHVASNALQSNVSVFRFGTRLFEWPGIPTQLSLPEGLGGSNPRRLTLRTSGKYRISELTLILPER